MIESAQTLSPTSDRRVASPSQLIGITAKFRGITTQVALLIAVAVLGFYFAKHTLGTMFQAYDDEGYMLISLAHYFSRGHLYTETFSQYGPFYFYLQDALFRLFHLPVTHDSGRFITLLYWMAAGVLAAWYVYKISNSLMLGSAAGLACVRLEAVLANEPGHPQQVVLVLLLLACCLSLAAGSSKKGIGLLLMGAVGAALFFTKINVGVFYMAALAHTILCVLPAGRLRKIGLGFMLAYAVVMPVFLMRLSLWDAPVFCLIAILCGGVTFAFGSRLVPETSLPLGRAMYAAAGFLSAGALIVLATALQGMSMRTLLEGVLLQPARQPLVFSTNLWIGPAYLFITASIVGGISAIWMFRNRLSASGDNFKRKIGTLRCAGGLAVIFLLLFFPSPFSAASFLHLPLLALCCAILPLSVIPLTERSQSLSHLLPRIFITDLAITQFLQAYPVAGSQVSIAAAPILLWAFVSIVDGITELGGVAKWAVRPALNTAFSMLIIVVLAVGMFSMAFPVNGYAYPHSSLSGSASLHLPTNEEQRYSFLAGRIGANCSLLFSMPGMGSFNFWSGVPTPNGWNLTGWMRAFSRERQAQIFNILKSDPRACVLYNKQLVRFWGTRAEELQSPLALYITNDMTRAEVAGDYEIRVNAARNSPWVEATGAATSISPDVNLRMKNHSRL